MWRGSLVLGVLALSLLAAGPSADDAATRSDYGVYVAADGEVGCTGDADPTGLMPTDSHRGWCFALDGREVTALIGLIDDTGQQPVSGSFAFLAADGTRLGEGDFCDRTETDVPIGTTVLGVSARALDPLACQPDIARGTMGHVEVEFTLNRGVSTAVLDVEPGECLEPVPAAVGVAGLTDQGQTVTLDVLVLLDGVSVQRGREVLAAAAEAYASLGIDLSARFKPVELSGTGGPDYSDSQHLLGQARETVGGSAPEGIDVVHTLTAKRMNVHGMADCLGGVRFPSRAFSVSSDIADRPIVYAGPVVGGMMENYAGTITAHEIGHLMGGHHHQGNDVEGEGIGPYDERSTVMASPAFFARDRRFSTVNGASVRGHAVQHATP